MNRAAIVLGWVWLTAWQLASLFGLLSEHLLPSPWAIVHALFHDYALWLPHFLTTFFTACCGFVLALLLAVILATVMDAIPLLRQALYPWLLVSQMVPLVFIYPIALLLLGFGLGTKIAVVTLVCFFPITISLVDGFARVPPDWERLLVSFGASKWQRFWFLRFPAALPSAFSGLRISATYCVMGAVIGEWMGARSGLGVYMLRAYKSFNSPRVFSAVLLVIGLSLLLIAIVKLAERQWSYTEHIK